MWTSLGSPVNTSLAAAFTDSAGATTDLGTVPVSAGRAVVELAVPTGAAAGAGALVLTATESGTVVKTEVQVGSSGPVQPVCTAPVPPSKWYDVPGWIRYGIARIQYEQCLRG